jgi:hypothetical protein
VGLFRNEDAGVRGVRRRWISVHESEGEEDGYHRQRQQLDQHVHNHSFSKHEMVKLEKRGVHGLRLQKQQIAIQS